jgi:hypothetical protein
VVDGDSDSLDLGDSGDPSLDGTAVELIDAGMMTIHDALGEEHQ